MTVFYLFLEFVKTSLFSFGGGYGTLPFIYYIANEYNWYSVKEIMQMVAVSAITPGAFGVNMATYTGYKVLGIFGAFVATVALLIPSYFLSVGIYKILKKYRNSQFVEDLLETLRAIASGLMLVVTLQMLNHSVFHISIVQKTMNFDYKAFVYLGLFIVIYFLVKKSIIWLMLISLILGIAMTYLHVF